MLVGVALLLDDQIKICIKYFTTRQMWHFYKQKYFTGTISVNQYTSGSITIRYKIMRICLKTSKKKIKFILKISINDKKCSSVGGWIFGDTICLL
jgi:hypothetical protein